MTRSVSVPDERILTVLDNGRDPIRTAPGMSDEINLSTDGLRRRLLKLEEQGEVESKRVGANAVVWWRP